MNNVRIAVVGLGYVGLPLAVEFGKILPTQGYDIDARRIAALREGRDHTQETSADEIQAATHLRVTADLGDIADANVYIVTVPTPVDEHKRPDFGPLVRASEAIGTVLRRG